MHTYRYSVARIGLTVVIGVVCAVGFSPVGAAKDPSRGAKLLHQFELPPTSLTLFGYTQALLDAALPQGLTVDDQPAIGSGLISLGGTHYLGITDRGPNIDHFPDTTPPCDSPAAPTGRRIRSSSSRPPSWSSTRMAARIDLVSIVNLVGNGGVPITGLSNFAAMTTTRRFSTRARARASST